ncbi:mechanosensitive ion channel family protein [Phenylobacterium kunshanense]|uniref:Mechanosensitive ion channel family protein n=1 Tax=Phenylobacterium kunshanense TaxID=1445034 RepID=A0A328BBC9_9CAUL|nr:mechanosensitive ion channel domain-containing protein [Phenylobacterium kunshanense]RAK63761.1 mechanosensitive ion channel family protein [Phenylobacterium kunshanense]
MDIQSFTRALEARLDWAPAWAFSLVLIGLALAAALAAYGGVVSVLRRRLTRKDSFWRPLLLRTRRPARLAICIGAISWAVHVAPLPAREATLVQHALLIGFIVLVGMALMTALDIGSALYLRRFRVDVSDNLLARKHLTQVRILRRALATLVIILTCAFVLMTIPGVRQLGVSLLAAGGAAGIIVGLALQPVLSNLLAGVQIALTQPIRIDDAVIVEGEWGRVEEITSTYVVVKIWDLRRLVVPLKYFLENPFQNWTRESADLLGTVMLYLDYSTPVPAIREKLEDILAGSPHWDGKTAVVQVTDARERTMEVRILASARDSGAAFDLRCEIRERMIAWLNADHPHALPRERFDVAFDDGPRVRRRDRARPPVDSAGTPASVAEAPALPR